MALTNGVGRQRADLLDSSMTELTRLKEANAQSISEQTTQIYASSRTTMILLVIAGVFAGMAIGIFVSRIIANPLRKTMGMIEEMGKGHLDLRLGLDRADEIGQMARTMDEFSDSLQFEVVAALQKLAEGDLTFEIQPKDERDVIRGSLKKLGEDLTDILSQVQMAGVQIASGSGQVSDASQALSQGATEQASSLEEITSSMTEMASQTRQNAENAGQASQLGAEARQAAERGNGQMKAMETAMQEINEAGQSVSKIIKTIDEIAFQTNLLALNAAVEAARAGQHGKGFAVVAEEVRNLAARSAKAARETAELIEGSVKKTENGNQIAGQTSEALREIVSRVGKVTDLVAEIAAASNEQAQGIAQVNQGLSQIDQVTQQNTASAEECASSAEELSSQAVQLKEMLSRFRLKGQPQYAAVDAGRSRTARISPANNHQTKKPAAAKLIALDDNEFGKY